VNLSTFLHGHYNDFPSIIIFLSNLPGMQYCTRQKIENAIFYTKFRATFHDLIQIICRNDKFQIQGGVHYQHFCEKNLKIHKEITSQQFSEGSHPFLSAAQFFLRIL
jgi:hypothetical protein